GNIIDFQVLKQIFRFVRPYIGRFYLLVFLTFALAVLAPVQPYLIQRTVDNNIATGDYQGLIDMILILVGVLVLQAIVMYFHTYLSGWLGQYIIRDIRTALYDHLLKLRLKFFDRTPIGRLVTRNISDIETLADVFSEGLASMIGDLLQLVFILALMFYTDVKLTIVVLCTLPFLLGTTYVFKEKIKVSFNNVRNAVANLNSFVQEHITGMSIVQIFNSEKEEHKKFTAINEEHKKAHMKSILYYSIYFPVAEVIQAAGIGLVVWFGASPVIRDELTLGMVVTYTMYIQICFKPVSILSQRYNTLQMGIVSSDRILKLLDNKEHIIGEGQYKPAEIKGNVQFKNVWFAYDKEDYVLKDISFDVKAGETIALVGATGAGKSSVINLLSRFYDINKGEICVDGVNIQEYDLAMLRKNIGVVLQDVFLFSDTIEQNITLGNSSITQEQVMYAAELVGAKRFIERLPGGLSYNVMERGSTLSVGQRQLISFVRAIVYDPK